MLTVRTSKDDAASNRDVKCMAGSCAASCLCVYSPVAEELPSARARASRGARVFGAARVENCELAEKSL